MQDRTFIKRILLGLTILMICLNTVSANQTVQTANQLFSKANQLYTVGNYQEALKYYQSIPETGYESWETYYNIANTYYRLVKYPEARLYYEKALLLSPENKVIMHNLQLTEQKLLDRFDEMPVFFASAWWLSLVGMFSSTGWGIAVLLLCLIFFICLSLYRISSGYSSKKVSFYLGGFIGILLLTSIACSVSSYKNHKLEYAVVMQDIVEAKTSPEERSETKFKIHAGSKVLLEEKVEPYYKIRIKDGNRAWIPIESVEKI